MINQRTCQPYKNIQEKIKPIFRRGTRHGMTLLDNNIQSHFQRSISSRNSISFFNIMRLYQSVMRVDVKVNADILLTLADEDVIFKASDKACHRIIILIKL
jgi:hypothetical protein